MSKSAIGETDTAAAPAPLPRSVRTLTLGVAVLALGAIAISGWVYSQTQRDLNRVATDIAQIKLSLQLFGQQRPDGANADSQALQAITNRLTILEQAWRSQASAANVPLAEAPTATGPQTDCIPQGTRFLVTNGDNYPICNSQAVIDVTAVGASYVTFSDGTIVTAGGNGVLKGTKCTVAVVSSGAQGMSGYAELRVGC